MIDPVTAFAVGGGILNIIQGFGNNKKVEAARRRANALSSVKASQLHARLGRKSDTAVGGVAVASADRNSIGRSAARLRLSLYSEALDERTNIEMSKFFEIASNNTQASNQKTNLLESAFSGAVAGFDLGTSLQGSSLFGKSTKDVPFAPQDLRQTY